MLDTGDRLRRPTAGPLVLLFGPLALSFDNAAFKQIRDTVTKGEDHQWVLETITELPHYSRMISAALPDLETGSSFKQLEDLKSAFLTQQSLEIPFPLPNAILIPLIVILHLTQYADHLKRYNTEIDERVDLFAASKKNDETLGFCTGLLSALAVSSADSKEDFRRYGATAVRLGLLIGMFVDAKDSKSELKTSKSLSTAWNSAGSKEELLRTLKEFPETYISVNYDDTRATVTTAASKITDLQAKLRASGVIASEIGLYGRFHTEGIEKQLKAVQSFCDEHPGFQFPDASSLKTPTRSNLDGTYITKGPLHDYALRSILLEPPQWSRAFKAVLSSTLSDKEALVLSFGPERCVPPSVQSKIGQQVLHLNDVDPAKLAFDSTQDERRLNLDNDIAVVGMACKVAGADDLEEFWDILSAGKSQHQEVPKERFSFETVYRDVDPKRKWFGNFINNYDTFDHKFFKRSPRESATMDPQQRQLLQIAYQAVEQSGYFHKPRPETNVGCYVGVCACDYENNIACHAANAFTATGNLKGFIAGKVSHHFGWTGPGLVIDTACSSSAVAVHQACKAILSGECDAALAGGTHVNSTPLWFQNLAGASFLSLTGQCKPFDVKADGYCRGEGCGAVYLKKLSTAIADGDQIQGIIAGTGVQQNENCTPIFVPNTPSLSDLFRQVTKKAQLKPSQISVVEAHGTGTAVGDPAEYESIRRVLGGEVRDKALHLSSVKGLVGHTECTSGIVSIIKILLMIQKAKIPPQASFSTINPGIKATPADKMIIPTSLSTWEETFRAALINNYGASGSNASVVLAQSPYTNIAPAADSVIQKSQGIKWPFWFCGLDDGSLRRYAKAFLRFLDRKSYREQDLLLPNISFNVARGSNRTLERALTFSARSVDELKDKLSAFQTGDSSVASVPRPAARPVVLCFGGQVSTFVGLDEDLYKGVAVLRKHLDSVDAVSRSIGAGSIFPGIFEREPVKDTVKLQTMLFAMQYSCARSWIDAGVQPVALVGHSFGELTALAIAQVLSLEDALRMIVSRATLVRDSWGAEKGSMMAVEGDLDDVEKLLSEAANILREGKPATIACYNGPRSFTLAGSFASIDAVAETITKNSAFSSMRNKRLNVSNAFHCSLLDHLVENLEKGAQGLTFREPKIHLERATESPSGEELTPKFVADHMRFPVYFNHALGRIAKQYPSSVFLEAGSNSTITSMAGRALGNPNTSHFQGINITADNAFNNLTDATLSLWKAGLNVQHWAHQASQTKEYTPLLLPPYQFDLAHHWVELKAPPKAIEAPAVIETKPEAERMPEGLLTFIGYQDGSQRISKFRVNTMIPKYDRLIEGHIIAQTAPICPATVQLDLAVEAVRTLRPDLVAASLEPQIHGVENQSPICINPARYVWIELDGSTGENAAMWTFEVFSTDSKESSAKTMHTSGQISFRSTEDNVFKIEFARFERLISHQRCTELLNSHDVEDIIQGRNIYRTFAEVVDYGEDYHGLKKLVGRGSESAGYVIKDYNPESWLDAHLADNFCQVGGIWVNCMTDRAPTDMYIANGIEQWIRNPKLRQNDPRPKAYDVFATHHRASDKGFLTDVFAFDATEGNLVEVILGISYMRIPKASMGKLLTRLTSADATTNQADVSAPLQPAEVKQQVAPVPAFALPPQPTTEVFAVKEAKEVKPPKEKKQAPEIDVAPKVKDVLADLSGLELDEIKDDSELADLGIDSLMGMEMATEIEKVFSIKLPESELMKITDMPSLLKCVRKAVGGGADVTEDSTDDSDEDAESKSSAPSSTTSSGTDTGLSTPAGESEIKFNPDDLKLPGATVLEAFAEIKAKTDDYIAEYHQDNYAHQVMPKQTELCISLTLDAFDQLGYSIRDAKPNQKLTRIPHPKEHVRLVEYLYGMLEKEAQLVSVNGGDITRTALTPSPKASKEIYEDLLANFPDQEVANKLTFYCGSKLAEVLRGNTDGIKLIFGTPEGRELVSGLYGDWPLNRLFYAQMEEFLSKLTSKLDMGDKPLKILEMGAGTGGTTKWLVSLLAKLNVPLEYTFTDLGPSFVAAARKKFKSHPFMKFRAHDIEKAPADDLIGSQHIVIASNAVHATHNLCDSTQNMRKLLRPDGFLMMLEMTGTLYWVDMVFGLFEGWWFFDDGRKHAVTHQSRWEKDLQAVGYGHVDWTDGQRPENELEKVIIAMASGSRYEKLPIPPTVKPTNDHSTDCSARQAAVDGYVRKMTDGFAEGVKPASSTTPSAGSSQGHTVIVTGATGSLGAHIVQNLANRSDVSRIVCLNRRSRQQDAQERQLASLTKKGIKLTQEKLDKLTILETDMFKPSLGLPTDIYENLLTSTTDIIHNAWLMNAKWPLKNFEAQLQIMRNLLDFTRESSNRKPSDEKMTFQFISSIATVGHWPITTGRPAVPEERMPIEAVLPTGYGDAKYICELMLDATLHRFPDRFRAMVIRPGQVAGSSTSGYWNPMEHLSFLWKSSQMLKCLPDFDGVLSWTPVDDVAGTCTDILLLPPDQSPHPTYHVENPLRQPWKEMIPVLASALDVPLPDGIIPYREWIQRVRDHPRKVEGPEGENPAFLLVDFLDDNFIRMSCGGLLLDTSRARQHSPTLANMGPVSPETTKLFVRSWKEMGFLK